MQTRLQVVRQQTNGADYLSKSIVANQGLFVCRHLLLLVCGFGTVRKDPRALRSVDLRSGIQDS